MASEIARAGRAERSRPESAPGGDSREAEAATPALAVRRSAVFGLGPAETAVRYRDEIAARDFYEVTGFGREFHFSWNALVMPDAALISFDAVGLRYDRDAARARADGFEDVRVQLTRRGGFLGRLGERDVVAGPGSAVFVDQSLPFANQSASTVGRTIALPRAVLGAFDARAMHGRVVSGAAYARLNDYVGWLLHALPDAPASARERVLAALGTVVRATFDGTAEAELQDAGAFDPVALQRLRALAVAPWEDGPRSVDEMARAVGASRSALYRAAQPFGGVKEVVWAARLEAARAALSDPAAKGTVTQIAHESGFADAKHFQRRFRSRFGFNPSDLRPIRG